MLAVWVLFLAVSDVHYQQQASADQCHDTGTTVGTVHPRRWMLGDYTLWTWGQRPVSEINLLPEVANEVCIERYGTRSRGREE